MVAAVQRNINPTVLDTGDSDHSETAEQIRTHHSVVILETPTGIHSDTH